MIKKSTDTWECCITRIPTTVLHEIWPGSARRKICIDYNLQVPVSHEIHEAAHGRMAKFRVPQIGWKIRFCEWLGIEYHRVNLAINRADFEYLREVSEHCKKKLEEAKI